MHICIYIFIIYQALKFKDQFELIKILSLYDRVILLHTLIISEASNVSHIFLLDATTIQKKNHRKNY